MEVECFSIEDDVNFTEKIKAHDTIAFCYPIYGSRVPRNMREFVAKHMSDLSGKKIIILVTQVIFSGDGARVFTDMFWDDTIEVIYAEHFNMPNNVGNVPVFRRSSDKKITKYVKNANVKMLQVCQDIKNGVIKKRGFSRFSQFLGKLQGNFWQGYSKEIEPGAKSIEQRSKNRVKMHQGCTLCGLCADICPVNNFAKDSNSIIPKGNCIVCYRCINRCPEKAISIWFNKKPKWQYKGIEKVVS